MDDRYEEELRELENEKRDLESLVRDVERRIQKKVNECKHDLVKMHEDGLYGQRYFLCRRCHRTF